MKIESIKLDKLIPYARNTRTHSPESGTETHICSEFFGDYRNAVVKRKWLCMPSHFLNWNQPSMRHVMMIRTKGDQILKRIASTFLARNYVMNSCHVTKPTNDAFPSIPHASGHLPRSWHVCLWSTGQSNPVTFFGALLRTKTKTFVFQHCWCDHNRLSTNTAGMLRSFVKRMIAASAFFAKKITARIGAVFSNFDVRPSFKIYPTLLAFMNHGSFPPASAIMPRHKTFSRCHR